MQTHEGFSHRRSEFLRELMERAGRGKKTGIASITAGSPGEKELASWRASNSMEVVHRPNDSQDIIRISIGGGPNAPVRMDYCVIRGTVGECIEMLERAIAALKESP